MIPKRKLIKTEIGIEKIISQNENFIIGAMIRVGNVSIGDTLNYLYKVRIFEVGEADSGDFRTEMFQLRNVSLKVKFIEFRGKSLNTISKGYSAQIELEGIDKELIDPPDDILGLIENY